MHPNPSAPLPAPPGSPVEGFSQCHAGILARLDAFAGLPALADAAARARQVAAATLELFEDAVLEHHAQEEEELFPAVLSSAAEGEEWLRVQAMVQQLTGEHRAVEAAWGRLRPAVKSAAAGRPVRFDTDALRDLVWRYQAHARFEEQHFLPLAQEILGRNGNHLAALGLSLHLRHAPQPPGYI